MELIIARQVAVMFLLIGTGFVCTKAGVLTEAAAKVFVNFVLMVVTPSIILKQFLRPADRELLILTGLALLLVVIYHVLALGLSHVLIPRREGTHYSSERIAAGYSNSAFMGFPLLEAALGADGLLFGVMYVAVFNICSWTHCLEELGGKGAFDPKKLVRNPTILSILLGGVIFLFHLPFPSLLETAVGHLAALNTPLSMVISGVFLAGLRPRELFEDLRLFWAVALRNLLLPLLFVVLLWAMGVSRWLPGAQGPVMAAVISAACPTAVIVILMSSRTGRCDPRYGAVLVAVSTLCSIVTLPLVIAAANALL